MNFKNITLEILFITISFVANSQDAEEIFQKGNSLTWDGKYDEALECVNKSLAIDSSLYQRYAFRAKIKANLGMYSEAIEDITKCINKCSCKTRKYHVASYYLERAELHVKNRDPQAAIIDAGKSIKSNPNDWKAYTYRSKLLIQAGETENALHDLNKSISLDANQAESYILRGELLIKMGNNSQACLDLSKVVSWGFDEYKPWINENCN